MRLVACALLALAPVVSAAAQSRDSAAVAPILSLEDAISIARRNNPVFLQTRSAQKRAGAALRSSYAVLLPNVSSSFYTVRGARSSSVASRSDPPQT